MQTVSEPKGARKENAFATWQSVNLFLLRPITQHKAVLHEFAFNRLDCVAHALIDHWEKTDQWHRKQTSVERVRAIKLSKRLLASVVTALANFRVDLVANLLPSLKVLVCRAATFLNQ